MVSEYFISLHLRSYLTSLGNSSFICKIEMKKGREEGTAEEMG